MGQFPLPAPVISDGELMADTQVLVDDEFSPMATNLEKRSIVRFLLRFI